MKPKLILFTVIFFSSNLLADNISGENELLCSASRAQLCVEDGECFSVPPADLEIPRFVIVNTDKKTISTTKSSGQNRTTKVTGLERGNGLIVMQGIDNGRAYSFLIEENTGVLTAAVAHHGLTVSVFGACTSTDMN